MQKIIFIGPPGSGKGTQATRLASRFGIPHISSGDLLRTHVARRTALGEAIRAALERGDLVPDAIILEVIGEALSATSAAAGYLLDGFPRTLAQE